MQLIINACALPPFVAYVYRRNAESIACLKCFVIRVCL